MVRINATILALDKCGKALFKVEMKNAARE